LNAVPAMGFRYLICLTFQKITTMKQKFGRKGETLMRNLIAGLNEAKRKWEVRLQAALKEESHEFDVMTIQYHINMCAEDIAAYKKMLKEGIEV